MLRYVLQVGCLLVLLMGSAQALITGSDGDEPATGRDWPAGVEQIFNLRERIAYWEGPSFGGGQYHGEYRGDTAVLNQVLEQFAKIDNPNKRIIVESGVGNSVWLNPNRKTGLSKRTDVDWTLVVWNKAGWQRQVGLPAELTRINSEQREQGPPTELTIYVGGSIEWDKLQLPEGVEVVDHRLEAHGYETTDGMVLEGHLLDMETGAPLTGEVRIERLHEKTVSGPQYEVVATPPLDDNGHWVWKNRAVGTYRVVAESKGFVPRLVGFATYNGQPSWRDTPCLLTKGGQVTGQVVDNHNNSLADVKVQLHGMMTSGVEPYQMTERLETTTDQQGRFALGPAPVGTASVSYGKPGYSIVGLRPRVSVPTQVLQLKLSKAANITAIVLFQSDDIPEHYMVELETEGGPAVGKWGGSAKVDEQNQYTFKNVPPGRYELWGHPNPSSEKEHTPRQKVEIVGGEEITLTIEVP